MLEARCLKSIEAFIVSYLKERTSLVIAEYKVPVDFFFDKVVFQGEGTEKQGTKVLLFWACF
jgi:hypothetical protein